MKLIVRTKGRLEGLLRAVGRYPLSTAFLLTATVLMAVTLHSDRQYSVEYFILLTGALLAACTQGLQERFFRSIGQRLMMMGIAVIILIPLVAVFTFILLVYILLNVRGEFWTNNLMEPLLVAYSSMGLLVLFLAGRVKNAFTRAYINLFPKVLIPLVLFQLIASVMVIPEVGLTYGRYFVLLYGVFAVAAGILGSVFLERKNHWIAGLLIVCMLISVIPPWTHFLSAVAVRPKD